MAKEMGAREAIGHIRSFSKLFKSLKYAEEVVEIVANAEVLVESLEKEVAKLDAEQEKLVEKCKAIQADIENKIFARKMEEDNAKSIVSNAKKEALRIKAEASEKADTLINKANGRVEGILSDIGASEARKRQAENEASKAEAELAKIKAQVEKAKEEFLKAVG